MFLARSAADGSEAGGWEVGKDQRLGFTQSARGNCCRR